MCVFMAGRLPSARRNLGLEFLGGLETGPGERLTRWEQYAQALLAANEFLYVD